MKFLLLFIFILAVTTARADDWGQTGHRTTAAIADQYLSKKAKRNIAKLLGHESLAVVSTFADDLKSDSQYRYLSPQHYVNIPFDKTYNTHPHSDKGDIITAIDNCIAILKSDSATDDEKAFQLKLLVHFIGDLHQPLHTGLEEDKGGNDFQVQWFNKGTNLHSVWDSKMIDSYGMSYTELAMNAPSLSKKEYRSLSQGTHRDWLADSRVVVKDIYKNVETGDKLGYRYMYDYKSTMKDQLLKGGTRLAALLNELFG